MALQTITSEFKQIQSNLIIHAKSSSDMSILLRRKSESGGFILEFMNRLESKLFYENKGVDYAIK